MILDITERKRDEERRRALEQQLLHAQKMESIGRLAGGVAHDINNLLTGILGNVELVRMDLPPGSDLEQLLLEVNDAARSAAALTRQLLSFSRRQVVEPVALDLNQSVQRIEKMLRRLIGENVTLETRLGEGLWTVHVDPGQLEQVIVNLAVNATDAMPGGGRLVIETGNAPSGSVSLAGEPRDHVRLSVRDTGMGMTDEVRAHAFEPFFTTKDEGKGTGLGLATVYGIVTQAGGVVLLDSAAGKGAAFDIYLPRAEVSAPTVSSFADAMPKGHGEIVLLVEDQPVLRTMVVRMLLRLGYEVIQAESGMVALEVAARHTSTIDLLLTDVIMPGLDGRQLAQKLRLLHPETKVLYTSGYAGEVIAQCGVVEGSLAFLPKPYTWNALAVKVREVLGK